MTIDYQTLQAIPQRDEAYHIVVTAAHHDDIDLAWPAASPAGSVRKARP